MRQYIAERIDGFPPIKNHAKSMWNDADQLPRLRRLRLALLAAMKGEPPLNANIRMVVRVHVGPANTKGTGDLDNYLGGICDGLQSAKGVWPLWEGPDCQDIHPCNKIAVVDDYAIVAIDAQKIIGPGEPWYSVELSGE
ncbi:MAG: hypothetical protein SFU86_02430 [Pirellulaceae bacterium]|nr:hypothetical protein [Pirellulaceae bacterium]